MKKIYLFLILVFASAGAFSQCAIDTTYINAAPSGMYPTAAHLPHAVRDSLYDQTVQGKIPDTMSMNIGGFLNVSIRVDSVRLDSINGLPAGINWVKNPDVLRGGHYGCVEFTGTASDTAGTYNLSAIGMVWAHLSVPILGINVDTFQYGSLMRVPPFNNYYLVVDSAPQPLSVTAVSNFICFGDGNVGIATATAHGGSPMAPYTYSWTTGSTHYRIDSLAAGTYTITVTSGTETASTTVVVAEQPSPMATTVTATGSTASDGTASVMVSGGVPPYTYFWTGGGGTSASISGLDPGSYRVTVRDSFGCIARDTAIVEDLSTGIFRLKEDMLRLSLFPNPANTDLNVLLDSKMLYASNIEIADMTGRIIYAFPLTSVGRTKQLIDVSTFGNGIYLMRMTVGGQSLHQRFTVSH